MRQILITGGTGFIGGALAEALLAEGDVSLHLMGRDFSRVYHLVKRGAKPVPTDLRDEEAVIATCRNIETVYHIGAISAPWTRRKQDFYAINVGGTENIIAGCRQNGVRRLVYVSSPSVVFAGQPFENLPDSAPYPNHFTSLYSETKKIGEDRVNAAFQNSDLETVILRPKAVFGPRDTTLLPRIIAAGRAGRLPQIGSGENRIDLTYIENVVDALRLAENAAAIGKTYTITNNEPVLLWQVIRRILRELGISDTLRPIPVSRALAVAHFLEAVAQITGREPLLTRYTVLLLSQTQTHDISSAQCDLGYTPRVSVEEGIVRTITAWKADAPNR
jgi:nucleoside-diphosphate-sugar epimerase